MLEVLKAVSIVSSVATILPSTCLIALIYLPSPPTSLAFNFSMAVLMLGSIPHLPAPVLSPAHNNTSPTFPPAGKCKLPGVVGWL